MNRHNVLRTTFYLFLITGAAFSSEKVETPKKDDSKKENSNTNLDDSVAQDRSLHIGLEHEDQIAIESRDGGYHAVAPPPPHYISPIPVPMPVPVQPGSIVLPGLPIGKQQGYGGGGHGGGGHGAGFSGGHGGGGFSGGHGGSIGGHGGSIGGHGGNIGGHGGNIGGHGGGFENHGGGFESHGGGLESHGGEFGPHIGDLGGHGGPPPAVYKAPLTRSSNPSPVSHGGGVGGESYVAPQESYAPPQESYAAPPQESYAAPSAFGHSTGTRHGHSADSFLGSSDNYSPPANSLSQDGFGAHDNSVVSGEVYNVPSSDGYSAPKQSDVYEGRQPIISNGDGGGFLGPIALPSQGHPVSDYQAPPAPALPAPIYSASNIAAAASLPDAAYASPNAIGNHDDPWQSSAHDMPQIANINVQCEKNLMKVTMEFDRPFYGIIFSKGHYSNVHCVHLPAGLGRTHATFDISINSCGTTGNTDNGLYGYGQQSGSGTFFENTLVIQYDPQVQEVWDQARKLRCTWHDQYEKSVTFRPFPVDMLDVVRADFAGDNVGCWMQIQVGKGPWASEVSGLVKIGQTMTMVLAIKDEDNKFDMLVRNCMAHDGKRAPIQLVDQRGCVTRPKLMSRFTKIKNFGSSASVLSYAHFQAFKFPDSMEVHFQCTIQICRYQCPDQCADSIPQQLGGQAYDLPAAVGEPRDNSYNRKRREAETDISKEGDIGVFRAIQVVSPGDLTFMINKEEILEELKKEESFNTATDDPASLICMSTPGFAATLVVLLSILIVSCLLSAFLCLRFRGQGDTQSIITSYQNPAFLQKRRFF